MRAHFVAYWENLRGSYWFIPALMALGAMVLAVVLTVLDNRFGDDWIEEIGWLAVNKPEGARALLSTVAGSMITVAGVVFSITISAVVYASSQYGPRLLTNFMQDRGNQVTLGTFIATFLYCLLVLRTVRSGEEAAEGAFVPHLAILCGLGLALASIGVLIYFIHHTPSSMHVSNVIARLGQEMHAQIEAHLTDQDASSDSGGSTDLPEGFVEEAVRVRAQEDGYLIAMDQHGLLHLATKHDLLLRLAFRPGDFGTRGQVLLLAWPPDRINKEVYDELREVFAWGSLRTQKQDLLFLVDELVEVAGRALSPGVNDPFTAMNCMDWLSGGLIRLARTTLPSAYSYDADGALRMISHPITFEAFTDAACSQLRPYASTDRNAALHMMKMLAEVLAATDNEAHRSVLLQHTHDLMRACREAPLPPIDLERVEAQFRTATHLAQPGVDPEAITKRLHGPEHRR